MGTTGIQFTKLITGGAVMLTACCFLYLLTGSQAFADNPGSFSWMITFDLVLTLPLIWFLTIRRQKTPRLTVYTVGLIGLGLAFVILPEAHRSPARWLVTYILPVAEGAVALYMFWNVRRLVKAYRSAGGADFIVKMRTAVEEVMGKKRLAQFVTGELAIVYYAFFARKKQKLARFTYHKKSSLALLSWVIALLLIVETLALHFLIALWSEPLAWVLSASNVYVFALLRANYRASILREIEMKEEALILHTGLFAEGNIPYHKIEMAGKGGFASLNDETTLNIAFLGYQNVRLELKEEHSLRVFPGRVRKFRNLYLHVDQRDEFIDAINQKISRL